MFDYLFEAASFLPHGFCLAWRPDLVFLHVASDTMIGLAYFSIPLAIMAFLRRKPDFEYRWVAHLFAAFIVLCGITHFAGAAMLWFPYYGLDGMLKAVTALVSVATALMLWPLLPKILAIPSPQALRLMNSQLAAEIEDRKAAEAALREAHDELERKVAERTRELAQSRQRLRLAAEAGNVGLWDWNLETGMVTRSDRCKAMLYIIEEPKSGFYFDSIHPDDRDRLQESVQKGIAEGTFRATFRVVTANDEVRWLESQGMVLHDVEEDDHYGSRFMGTLIDITEQITAREDLARLVKEKETLLQEVHHRVKNNLQSLLSLIQMEMRQNTHPALIERLEAIKARIRVMAEIHQNLYTSKTLSTVDIGAQIASLCAATRALLPPDSHITLIDNTEEICCNLDTAIPVGLLANELLTNAIKHGFPDGRAGTIEVSLRRYGNAVILAVTDDGVGVDVDQVPLESVPQGIGQTLIRALTLQLRGQLTVMMTHGTSVVIKIPNTGFVEAPCPQGVTTFG